MNLLGALNRLFLSRLRWLFATGDERDAEIQSLQTFVRTRVCPEASILVTVQVVAPADRSRASP